MPIAYLPFSTTEPRATPPSDYLNVPTTPREFGAGVAQGLQTFGSGASHAGQVFGEMAADDQANQTLSGLADINANLRNLQGKDRMEAYPKARQQMDDLVSKARGNLTTINQTIDFDRQVRFLHSRAQREAGDLYDQAEQQYGIGVSKAKALTALNTGSQAIVSGDADTVTHGANQFIDARVDEAKRHFGTDMGDDVRDSVITNARREYMEGLIRTLMVTPGREGQAQTMFDNNRSLFSGTPGTDALANAVKAHAFKGQVDGLVAGAISGNMPGGFAGGVSAGSANYAKRSGALGDPNASNYEAEHITSISSPSGVNFRVNKAAAQDFSGFLKDLEASGYKIRQEDSGGYNKRNIAGTDTLSEHAFGNAIDINAGDNPSLKGDNLKTNLPPNIRQIAAAHNLTWGGDWHDLKDAMHFEWAGPGGTRGAQNNNPGNIKPGGVLASYPTPQAGVQAIDDWLQKAQTERGLTTVRQLIDDPKFGYAPSNDPGNAGKDLPIKAAQMVGVAPDAPVDMGDPVIRSKMVNAILTQEQGASAAARYMQMRRAATDLGVQGGLVPSGATTPAYRSEGLTAALDRIEASDAAPEAKELAAQRVERRFRDQQIEQDRYEAQVRRQQKDASDARANQIVTAMADPTQHVTVTDIRADPSLEWQTKEHLIGALAAHPGGDPAAAAQAYGPGFWDAYKGVTASADDPDRITDQNAILRRAGPGGDLTLAGAEKLSALVGKVSKPEHLGEAKVQAGALAYAKHQLSFEADYGTFKVRDPKGEDTFNIGFTPAFFKYWEGGLAAGKTPQELADKASIDNVIQPFKRAPADEMRDKLEAGEETKPQALKIPTPDELAKMGPQELVAAVRTNPALRSQAEALALKNGWIRGAPTPPMGGQGAAAPIPP